MAELPRCRVSGTRVAKLAFNSRLSGGPFVYRIPTKLAELCIDVDSSTPGEADAMSTNAPPALATSALLYVVALRGDRISWCALDGEIPRELAVAVRQAFRLRRVVERFGRRVPSVDGIRELQAAIAGGEPAALAPFRTALTWINGEVPQHATLVPPPSSAIPELMDDFVAFASRVDLPAWIRLALLYYQIIAIHPFRDGNGRLSRVLVAVLGSRYLSLGRACAIAAGLTMHRASLAEMLDRVGDGDIAAYIEYWKHLVQASAKWIGECEAEASAVRGDLLAALADLPKRAGFCDALEQSPIVGQDELRTLVGGSMKLASRYVDALIERGVLRAVSSIRRGDDARYVCTRVIDYWQTTSQSIRVAAATFEPRVAALVAKEQR